MNKTFDFSFILFSIIVAVFGAIIGMQLITSLGITPNTSIIGALIAMMVARIPMQMFYKYRSLQNQNLIQTTISAATFGAANSLLIPLGLPYVLGMPELIIPMLIGAGLALFIDVFILYKVFDSKIFGSNEAWPPGIATAEALKAGDEGGSKAKYLGLGILGGLVGSHFGISMSAFGVAFIGNIWALTMFGIGLLLRGYSVQLFGVDLNEFYIPHGMMIGAGIVALLQFVITIVKSRREKARRERANEQDQDTFVYTRTPTDVTKGFGIGFALYMAAAILLASLGGIITDMPLWQTVLFVLFAAFAALASEIIVGIAAMHSGWFPAFAVTLISLLIGMMLGFPPVALALLTGFTAATGPAFADLGYDFKTGVIIRNGASSAQELFGRRQQLKSSLIGFGVAVVMVFLFAESFFAQDLVPPVDLVYATTIEAGLTGDVGMMLLLWAIPGALIQLIGGPSRQMGILLATGLLIVNPIAGWAVIAGILIRITILKVRGPEAENTMYTTAAGFIAGDAIYSFFTSIWKAR
ncbi:OPT/YSL family transporter [Planomicrobium sp. CPCC 101079]|uniref:OPT/YSL family transporter n=1 Tax=Planomicrobium sp. CPCC 101079 TaxID=2599618 RepID=UPI0011B4403A|nr:OPT/YSL family transporter [Planomicrobium sp. CPCC 101079]TWT03639.1 OPT family oligopeptide transporter [Planomicrobium sp. CPCC 101079]